MPTCWLTKWLGYRWIERQQSPLSVQGHWLLDPRVLCTGESATSGRSCAVAACHR
jgi:hypothetical protein